MTAQTADSTRIARIATLLTTPVAPAATFFTGNALLPILLPAVVFSVIAFASAKADPKFRPILIAIALIGQCLVLTASFAGHAWQIDTHMAFFAALAIIATTGSLAALATGVVLTAVHHLTLGFFLPALVYPSSDALENFFRTVMHALIVLFEAAFLFLSIRFTAAATKEIEAARRQLEQSSEQATDARLAAEQARERALQIAELTRMEGRQAAVAVEQISAVARTAAENSANSQQLVSRAKTDAENSGQVIAHTKDAMVAIKESSDQISHIVEMIDEIARRTDLLALNAAVESARAGDAGRGFAVVANEVRKLAQQSADATLQIRSLVKTSTGRVQEGSNLVEETSTALDRISKAVSDLDVRMRDIAHGAAEQFSGLQQVTVAINRIDQIALDDAETDEGDEGQTYGPADLAAVKAA